MWLGELSEFVRVNMGGEVVWEVYEEGKRFNVVVGGGEWEGGRMEGVKEVMIEDGEGGKIGV